MGVISKYMARNFFLKPNTIVGPQWIVGVLILAGLLAILCGSFFSETEKYKQEMKDGPVLFIEIKEIIPVLSEITAYNSERGQTDSTPFLTASNKRVYDGVVANNCHPFGTRVLIEGKEYEVQDRMNSRYTKCGKDEMWYFDIWFETKKQALEWGVKKIPVKILYN